MVLFVANVSHEKRVHEIAVECGAVKRVSTWSRQSCVEVHDVPSGENRGTVCAALMLKWYTILFY